MSELKLSRNYPCFALQFCCNLFAVAANAGISPSVPNIQPSGGFMRTLFSCLLLTLTLSLPAAWSIPRYSVMYNMSCTLCHVDPSGGGSRSLYGAQFFAYSDLPMSKLSMDELIRVNPMLNEQIQIGLDARTIFYALDDLDSTGFNQMQGDLYLIYNLDSTWTFLLSKGLYSGFEAFGLGHILPWNGYVKIGRFRPPYGLNLADHKAFVRQYLTFGSQGTNWQETGLEVGFHPQRLFLGLSVTKNMGPIFGGTTDAPAITARTDYRFNLGEMNSLWIGLTGRLGEVNGVDDRLAGVYGGLGLGRFFFTGELDWHDRNEERLVTFAELAFLLRQGLLLKVEHDFYDPDLDVTSGAENMFVAGAEITPTGFLQWIPNVRYHDFETGGGDDYFEYELQFHVFY